MKFIERHPPIQLVDPRSGRPYDLPPVTMESYLNGFPLNDKRFSPSEGCAAVFAGGRIQVAAKGLSPYIELQDGDHKILREVLEKPQTIAGEPMSPEMARQVQPMTIAILNASSTDPTAKKAKAKRAKKPKAPKKQPPVSPNKPAISPSDAGAEVVN